MLLFAAALKALNWMPGAFEKGLMRQYRSIEEARAALGLGQVRAPRVHVRRRSHGLRPPL
jgi:hypothetical protein